jgi:hypothetical protein
MAIGATNWLATNCRPNTGQVGYRRRDVSAKHRLPTYIDLPTTPKKFQNNQKKTIGNI